MTVRRTYIFKLYKSKKNRKLYRQIWVASQIYNHCIALIKRYYRWYKKHLNVNQLQKHLTKLKKIKGFQHWNELGSQAIQDIAQRIDRAYQLFFSALEGKRKVSPPSFKAARKYKSFTLKQAGYKFLEGNRVRIGQTIYKFAQSREVEGTIKTLTIKRDRLGDLYLCLSCAVEISPDLPTTGQMAGFDFGLKTFLTPSEGQKIRSPLFFRQGQAAWREAHRSLSRKQKGSGHRRQARRQLARVSRRIRNQRKDFHFKQARQLAGRYDVLIFEDLNLKAMQRCYGKKIGDLGFDDFLRILESYCQTNGKRIHFIDRWEPTSKTCSVCLYPLAELPLKVREWDCPGCGTHHDRDVNAARNILRVGASTLRRDGVRLAQPAAIAF